MFIFWLSYFLLNTFFLFALIRDYNITSNSMAKNKDEDILLRENIRIDNNHILPRSWSMDIVNFMVIFIINIAFSAFACFTFLV